MESQLASLQKAAGNPVDISAQNTSACCFDMVWLGHKEGALSQGMEMPSPQILLPCCNQRGREMVEIAKPFLLFTLFFSCLNPAGTVDDEHSASFLSDQLLSGIATQGGSFLGKMSRDKGHTQLLLLRVLLSS